MPLTITTNTEYSLFENSYVIRKLRRKEATFTSAKDEVINELTKACNEEEVYTAMDVLKNLNFYILFLGHAGLTMRRGSYLGWLGKNIFFAKIFICLRKRMARVGRRRR